MSMMEFVEEAIIPLHYTMRYGPYPSVSDKPVTAHTFDVCILSYFFALEVEDADEYVVLEKAILHDLEESETGDIPRFVKHGNGELKKELEKVEDETVRERLSGVVPDHHDYLWDTWKNSKDDSVEGNIVRAADIIAAILDFYTEKKLGNELIYEQADIHDGIEDAKDICEGIPPAEELLWDILSNMDHE